jgi:leucyl-tRNA synthetase
VIYQKTAAVNWDPVDQTVLANEQVIDGRGWRSGALVEKRDIPMYFFRITAYAEELLSELDNLPGWPERVKTMQRNWIGKSFGVEIHFPLPAPPPQAAHRAGRGKTRPAVGVHHPRRHAVRRHLCRRRGEHPLATQAAANNPALAAFIAECKQGSVPKPTWRRWKRRAWTPASRSTTRSPTSRAGVGRQLCADGLRRRRGDGGAGA